MSRDLVWYVFISVVSLMSSSISLLYNSIGFYQALHTKPSARAPAIPLTFAS